MLSGPRDICHSSLMHQDGKGLHTLILSLVGLKVGADLVCLVEHIIGGC